MRHLKLFDINLILVFGSDYEYKKAIDFFENDSQFSPDKYDDEFGSISFSCTNQEDADATG
jgi:hypothetical protein